eukprot:2753080-Pleurochrysis_carterae.AAC.1
MQSHHEGNAKSNDCPSTALSLLTKTNATDQFICLKIYQGRAQRRTVHATVACCAEQVDGRHTRVYA